MQQSDPILPSCESPLPERLLLRLAGLPDLFTRDPKQAAQLSKARAGAASALQRAEEVWLEASSQFEKAAG